MGDRDNKKYSSKSEIKTYFMPLSEAAKIAGYTVEHLNLLCRKKILKGMKVGRNWHTTKEWLNEFLFLPKNGRGGKEYKRRKKTKSDLEAEMREEYYPIIKFEQADEQEKDFDKFNEEENISEEITVAPKIIEKEKFSWTKTIVVSLTTLCISIFLFSGISYWKFLDTRNNLIKRGIPMDLSEDTFLFNEKKGVVEGEESVAANETETPPVNGPVAVSENYKMEQINFGGANIALANMDNEPLEIYDVRSETFNSKDGKQAEILVSWKTSKLTISELGYSKDGSENSKNLQEKYYGFNHNAVLTNLEMATAYNYEIKSRDRWGNELSSEKFRAYTGSKVVSVFELIMKALSDTFGWAVNK